MDWVVVCDQAQAEWGRYKTKKAASEAAEHMTAAHRQADARHDGQQLTFSVDKRPVPEPHETPEPRKIEDPS